MIGIKTLVFGPGFFYGIITDMEDMPWIYETPDRGETVYRRPFGSNSWDRKELVSETPQAAWRRKRSIWQDILVDAPKDPILMDMLEKIEVYYRMKQHEKS